MSVFDNFPSLGPDTYTLAGVENLSNLHNTLPSNIQYLEVPTGATLFIDTDSDARSYIAIRVFGDIKYDRGVNTRLRVETLIIEPSGYLEIGTDVFRINHDVSARLSFVDNGPIDRVDDPSGITRGLLSKGTVSIHGAVEHPWYEVDGFLPAGTSNITLNPEEGSVKWVSGQKIVVAGTHHGEDEVKTVVSVTDEVITIDVPLTYDHVSPDPTVLHNHVALLERNVIIESEASFDDRDRLGHTMFMSSDVNINHAEFKKLGRTDKLRNVTDHPGGDNPRARYALHFHRTGIDPRIDSPAYLKGLFINQGVGWGIVNHSSYVVAEDCVSFDVDGSGFVGETGNEIGSFENCLAVGSKGSGELPDQRQLKDIVDGVPDANSNDDFGTGGHGFWLQGPGIEVVNCVATGHRHAGFVLWSRSLFEPSISDDITQFTSFNSQRKYLNFNAGIDPPDDLSKSEFINLVGFKNNLAYGCAMGLDISRHQMNFPKALPQVQSTIEDFVAWNIGSFNDEHGHPKNGTDQGSQGGLNAMCVRYSKNLNFKNCKVWIPNNLEAFGLNHNDNVTNISVTDCRFNFVDPAPTGIRNF